MGVCVGPAKLPPISDKWTVVSLGVVVAAGFTRPHGANSALGCRDEVDPRQLWSFVWANFVIDIGSPLSPWIPFTHTGQ